MVSITDTTVAIPFKITKDMFETARAVTKDCPSDEEKAKRLFYYLKSLIHYGDEKRGIVGYRDSIEVWTTKEGVCGEMSYLYITLARSIGLKAGYVHVDRDFRDEEVNHACAWVKLNNRDVLVDIAYHTFDIKHKRYFKVSDKEAMRRFESWR